MALVPPLAKLLLSESKLRPFGGDVLQLGRQTVLFSGREFYSWARRACVDLPDSDLTTNAKHMSDEEFFTLMGFTRIFSCDVSAYEQANLAVDLNLPVPSTLHARFDLVYDGGTMEHIFDVPSVLQNTHAMLKDGGRIVHVAGASNMVDHGFYSFSPTFFSDYYGTNGYRLLTLYFFECVSWSGKWEIYDCLSGSLDNRLGRLSTSKMSGVFCVAQKTPQSTSRLAPSQKHFSRLWSDEHQAVDSSSTLRSAVKAYLPRLAEFLYRTRALLWRTVPGRRSAMPPFLGRL